MFSVFITVYFLNRYIISFRQYEKDSTLATQTKMFWRRKRFSLILTCLLLVLVVIALDAFLSNIILGERGQQILGKRFLIVLKS